MNNPHSASDAAAAANHHDWGSLTWLAGSVPGNSERLAAAYVVIKQGQQNPRHRHNTCEEILYLISGTLRHSLAGESFTLNGGDTLVIPAGVFHNAVNTGREDAHMLVVYSAAERDFELENVQPERTSTHE